MASRKDEKEQAKEQRLAAEQADASKESRQRMFAIIGGVALVAVVVVVVLIAVNQSGTSGGDPNTITTNSTVDLVDGLPQNGTILGDPKAPVTIVEFGDLQCPACKVFSDKSIPEILSGPVTAGDANIEFKNFLIIGPQSADAARAALAASEQGRYWQFIETFYANQGIENSGYVTDEFLTNVAEKAGVEDMDAWNASRSSKKWDAQLKQILVEAQRNGFQSTPSVLVEGPKGRQIVGAAPSTSQVEDAVKQASGGSSN